VPTDAEILRSTQTLRRLGPQLREAVKALRVLEASMGEEVFGKFNVGPDDEIDLEELGAFVRMARQECQGMALQIVVIAH
jgi:hypothetical protein